jgi:hypothetical protein
MTPPDSRKVRELYDAVVELLPDERRWYLDAHCPDPELRQWVERMLKADASAQQQLFPDLAFLITPTTRSYVGGPRSRATAPNSPRCRGTRSSPSWGKAAWVWCTRRGRWL